MAYPTPPPTNSPKHSTYNAEMQNSTAQGYPTQRNPNYEPPSQSQTYQQPYQQQAYNTSTQPVQAQDPSSFQTAQLSYNPPTKIPAQDSYYHSFSAPTSPAPPSQPSYEKTNSHPPPKPSSEPHRRRSSPTQSPLTQPSKRRSSPLMGIRPTTPPRQSRSPGNPNYYSTSPLPFSLSPKPGLTPYNLNRPKKRPGFWGRIVDKFESWIKAFMRWTKRNPITMGLLTFIPVMTIAGVAKAVRVVGQGMGWIEKGHKRPKPERGGSSRLVDGEGKRNVRFHEDEDEGEGILDRFTGVGGASKKSGPVESVLKIVQMLV